MKPTALIVGSSGIVGSAAARLLVSEDWNVLGLARRPMPQDGVTPITADLQDPAALTAALQGESADACVSDLMAAPADGG